MLSNETAFFLPPSDAAMFAGTDKRTYINANLKARFAATAERRGGPGNLNVFDPSLYPRQRWKANSSEGSLCGSDTISSLLKVEHRLQGKVASM